MYRIGVDIGGTFTDFFLFEEDTGEVKVHKTSSTPGNPALGLLNGLEEAGIAGKDISVIAHGSTVGTNALISRQFKQAGLMVTKGFRDVLEIGEGSLPNIWDMYNEKRRPYVWRRNVLEIEERMDYAGNELTPLSDEDVRAACRVFRRRGIDSVAICFLHSYRNPSHELRAKQIVSEELAGAYCCTSFEILPEIMEVPRFSTTIINATLAPVVSNYLNTLITELKKRGYDRDLLIVHSAAGVMTADMIAFYASRIANSGPSAGAAVAAFVAKELCGLPHAMGLDVGGTSADISFMYDGKLRMAKEWEVEFGYPIAFPNVEVHSIGAGGGSIAWRDEGGSLRVGPASQGSDPGPACYLRGGDKATLSDANLVLNRLDPDWVLAGSLRVDKAAAEKVVGELGKQFDLGAVETASAIVDIANANMEDAIRLVSIHRGYDPRDFALVVFGGAGPLCAVAVAKALGIPKVIVPRWPGITSAMGCLLVDIRHDVARTFVSSLSAVNVDELESRFVEAENDALTRLSAEGIPRQKVTLMRQIDLRYVGQWRELTVDMPSRVPDSLDELRQRFDKEHQREYAYSDPNKDIEVFRIRVVAIGEVKKPRFLKIESRSTLGDALIGSREVYDSESHRFLKSKIYHREKMPAGGHVVGPAVIQQYDSTTWLPPTSRATVDDYGNVVVEVG